MKKAILARALMGFPMGIAIGQCISLLVSAILGGGAVSVVTDYDAVPVLEEVTLTWS